MTNKMKTIISFSLVAAFVFLSSCGGKDKLSLARVKQHKDMSACLELAKKKKHDQAIQCFEAYKSRHFGSASAAIADLAVADTYFLKKNYLVAAEAYQIFIETNPAHEKVPYAYYKAGLSYLNETPKDIDRDQNYLDSAVSFLEIVLKYYPHTPYAGMAKVYHDKARLKKARKHFYIGRFYFKNREYLAAIPRFQMIVMDYSKLGLDEKSFFYLVKSYVRTSQKELAMQYLDVFKEHYPQSKFVKKLGKSL